MASFTVVKARPRWADLGLVLRLAVGRNMRVSLIIFGIISMSWVVTGISHIVGFGS